MNKDDEEEVLAALALTMASGIPSHQKVLLVRRAGSCRQAAEEFPGGLSIELHRRAERDLLGCRRSGIRVITWSSPDYPALLEACTDPPLVLHVRGSLEPQDLISLAIVGSRRATPYGIEVAEHLSGDLAGRGITIISGLQSSLDMDAGGEISTNLDDLYDYMVRRLGEAGAANDPAILDEITSLLIEVKSAWDVIPRQLSAAGRQAAS